MDNNLKTLLTGKVDSKVNKHLSNIQRRGIDKYLGKDGLSVGKDFNAIERLVGKGRFMSKR